MSKKLLHFIVFSLVGLAVFLAGYLFTTKPDLIGRQALINNSLVNRFGKTEEKYAAPKGVFELTPGEASFANLSTTGEVVYYVPRNGEIRSISIKNYSAGSSLIAKIQPGATYISWGANKTLLAIHPAGSVFYDLTSNYSKKYPLSVKNPVLNRAGTAIAYTYFNDESAEGNITIADPKLESYKNITPTRLSSWQIKWLDDERLALLKPPTLENTKHSLFILHTKGSALENVLELKSDLELTWFNNGQKLIYSYANPLIQETGLYAMDLDFKLETPLKPTLRASKCAWSMGGKKVYCAGSDSFVSIDTSSPEEPAEQIADALANTYSANATNLLLNSTEDYLIFKNSKDGKLYGLSLR